MIPSIYVYFRRHLVRQSIIARNNSIKFIGAITMKTSYESIIFRSEIIEFLHT